MDRVLRRREQPTKEEDTGSIMKSNDTTLLIADIGGTKTDIALAPTTETVLGAGGVTTLLNREYDGVERMLDRFLGEHPARPAAACFAIAGPVLGDRTQLTNLPWQLDARSLETHYSMDKVLLVNDVHALGWLVANLPNDDSIPLVSGSIRPNGTVLAISPGTGLGVSFVTQSGKCRHAFPSEGGHAAFAPTTHEQDRLLAFVRRELGYVGVEDLCSGTGIQRIHRFLVTTRPQDAMTEDVDIANAPGATRTPQIVDLGMSADGTQLAHETLRLFLEILADTTRSAALAFMATGGVYLAGNLPLKLTPLLAEQFERAFSRFREHPAAYLNTPVHLVTKPHPVLHGAHQYAVHQLGGCKS